jgi:hypothetical protein
MNINSYWGSDWGSETLRTSHDEQGCLTDLRERMEQVAEAISTTVTGQLCSCHGHSDIVSKQPEKPVQ